MLMNMSTLGPYEDREWNRTPFRCCLSWEFPRPLQQQTCTGIAETYIEIPFWYGKTMCNCQPIPMDFKICWTTKVRTLRKRKARALPRTHYAAYRRSLSMVEASKISHSVLSMSQLDQNCEGVGEDSSSVVADAWFGPISIVRLRKYKPITVFWESRSRKLVTQVCIHVEITWRCARSQDSTYHSSVLHWLTAQAWYLHNGW